MVNTYAPDVVKLAEHVGNRLEQACGGGELVSDRRGSRVYCLRFATGDVALKIAYATRTTKESVKLNTSPVAKRPSSATCTNSHPATSSSLVNCLVAALGWPSAGSKA